MYDVDWLMRVMIAWFCGDVTGREWHRAKRIVAYGPNGSDVLRRWYELRAR